MTNQKTNNIRRGKIRQKRRQLALFGVGRC
jgi:hypothetical protein